MKTRLTRYLVALSGLALIAGTAACGGGSDKKKDTGMSGDKDAGSTGDEDPDTMTGGDKDGMTGGGDKDGMTGGGDKDGMTGGQDGGGTDTMQMSLNFGSPPPKAGDGFMWEGWLKKPNEAPVSTGQLNGQDGKSTYTFEVSADLAENAAKFILTLEEDEAGTPSKTKFVAADLSDMSGTANLTTAPAMAGKAGQIVDSSKSHTYILNTPTTPNESDDYNMGIWWLEPPSNQGGSPSASLDLPEAPEGWQYEGWVVDTSGDSPQPISTGTFTSPSGYDSDDAGPNAGKDEGQDGPPFPGQDFIKNGGRNLTNGNYKAVVSVEPKPDNSDKPFVLKPLTADIPTDADQGAPQDHSIVDSGNLPTVEVTIGSSS